MITVVTCTYRPGFFDNIIANFTRQTFKEKELIIIINCQEGSVEEWENYELGNLKVVKWPNKTLGQCLNDGIRLAKYDFVAKFDDDDYYSSEYLTKSLEDLQMTTADVVGKATAYIYYKPKQLLTLYKPGFENTFIQENRKENQFLFGGTLLFHKKVWEDVRFQNISRGIDFYFCAACVDRGFKLYSSNRCHFLYIRYGEKNHHTTNTTDHRMLRKSMKIKEGEPLEKLLDIIDCKFKA